MNLPENPYERYERLGSSSIAQKERTMKTYSVTVPIAGHLVTEVEANSEEEAVRLAIENASFEEIEHWGALEQFNSGNVCHCPEPWKATARVIDDGN